MKFFEATFDVVLIRFYLMMGVIIAAFLVNLPLLAFLALPIFLSAMLGIQVPALQFKAKKSRAVHMMAKRSTAIIEAA